MQTDREVHVSGSYQHEGEVHVSGVGATRVLDSGNAYQNAPVAHDPYRPAHHDRYRPAHPAPAYPAHHVPAYPSPPRHPAPAYPHQAAPAHDNVHVSGSAGSARVLDSGNAYQGAPAHHAPAHPNDVLVSGTAGGVRVEDFQPSYTHAQPDYQPHVVVPAHLEQPVGAGPYEPAPYQPEMEHHVPEPVYRPEEPVVVPYSQGDDVPEFVISSGPQYDDAHLPTLYEDEHYVPETHEIETVYES